MSGSNSMPGTCVSLIARAAMRDQRAWESLVDLYAPLVASWCKRMGMRGDAIADVTQDVFLTVLNSLSSFRSSPGSGVFRAWLWRITKSRLIDRVRSNATECVAEGGSMASRLLSEIIDLNSLPLDEPSDAHEIDLLMQRGLQQVEAEFEPRTWQAFWRTVVDGMDTSLVADELKMNPAGVRQARSRVLRRLREQLGDTGAV